VAFVQKEKNVAIPGKNRDWKRKRRRGVIFLHITGNKRRHTIFRLPLFAGDVFARQYQFANERSLLNSQEAARAKFCSSTPPTSGPVDGESAPFSGA